MRRDAQQGVALLLTLVFVAVVSVIVVEFCYETRVEAALVAAGENEFEALVAAKSAVASGVSLLAADLFMNTVLEDGASGYDSLDEPWATGVPAQSINNGVMQCSIDDEWGKLNLNALIMPEVTVWPRPNGLPIATAKSPTRSSDESAKGMCVNFSLSCSTFKIATSASGSEPTIVASSCWPSCRVTAISSAPSIT